MNELLENNQNLDLNFYKDQIFSAVHIGDFVLDDDTKKVSPLPKICVVMPVYNTKPSYIRSAVESVTTKQSYQGQIKLVIVDDGSTDARVAKYLE